MAKDKKWIQKVSASIKRRGTKGKCTPITKPGCTGRAKALAKTFKKMARKRKGKAMGGSIGGTDRPKYLGMARGGMTPTAGEQPYTGSYIQGDLGGVSVSNPSLRKFYGSKIIG
tara:strand:+ start:106 stop:447 length:342 start_codon:yes stop_codon:yes gene_type:complete